MKKILFLAIAAFPLFAHAGRSYVTVWNCSVDKHGKYSYGGHSSSEGEFEPGWGKRTIVIRDMAENPYEVVVTSEKFTNGMDRYSLKVVATNLVTQEVGWLNLSYPTPRGKDGMLIVNDWMSGAEACKAAAAASPTKSALQVGVVIAPEEVAPGAATEGKQP